MTNKDTTEKCREVFMADMKTSDLMDELTREHDPEDIEDGAVSVIEDTLANIQDPRREIAFLSTAQRIGQLIESEGLVTFADKRIQEWKENNA